MSGNTTSAPATGTGANTLVGGGGAAVHDAFFDDISIGYGNYACAVGDAVKGGMQYFPEAGSLFEPAGGMATRGGLRNEELLSTCEETDQSHMHATSRLDTHASWG